MTHVCMRMCVALFLLIKVFFFYYCVCAIVCVCMRVGLYVCVRLCLGLYTRVPVCVCMSASEFCACVSLCKRVSVRTREYVCARVCARECVHARECVCIQLRLSWFHYYDPANEMFRWAIIFHHRIDYSATIHFLYPSTGNCWLRIIPCVPIC